MQMTPDDLMQHLIGIEEATEQERDEMLTDLLVTTYPKRINQDN